MTLYQKKDLYILDFSDVPSVSAAHGMIKKEFDFPEYYGYNLDALWDCLGDISGRENRVEIRGAKAFSERFPEKAERLIGMFLMWEQSRRDDGETNITVTVKDN